VRLGSPRPAISGLILACLLLATVPANADAFDAALARAIAAKERAMDSNDPASWEDALLRFVEADNLRATRETKYELGLAAAHLRQDDLAVESYEAAIDLGLEGSALDKARAFVGEHQSAMGRLDVHGPESTVIAVGQRRRTLPLDRPMVLFPGSYSVRAMVDGREVTVTVRVEAGGKAVVDLATAPRHEEPADAAIERRGEHAAPGVGNRALAKPTERDHSLAWALVGSGAGLAVVGGGTVLGTTWALGSRRDELADLCAVSSDEDSCAYAHPGRQNEAQSKVDAIATTKAVRTGGWVGLGVGAGLAAIGGVLLLGGAGEDAGHGVSVAVVPTPGLMSVSVTGAL
jgi:hypothetical protein